MTSSSPHTFFHAPARRFDETTQSSVIWREVHPGFWVARCGGDPVGAIEHVRTYVTTNVRGDVIGSYASIPEAQAALSAPPTTRRHATRPTTRRATSSGLLRRASMMAARLRPFAH